MSPDVVATGVFTLLGVLVGLLGEPLTRRLGRVRCTIDSWKRSAGTPEEPVTRMLQVTFLNGKELPVVVREMRVEFYKGGKPVPEWARPHLEFVDETSVQPRRPLGPVNLPSREAVPLTISVSAGGDRDDAWKELAKVDRAVFTAKLVGAGDKRRELSPPWQGDGPL
jgi:hypothetical protein